MPVKADPDGCGSGDGVVLGTTGIGVDSADRAKVDGSLPWARLLLLSEPLGGGWVDAMSMQDAPHRCNGGVIRAAARRPAFGSSARRGVDCPRPNEPGICV